MDGQTLSRGNVMGKMIFNLGYVHAVGEIPFYLCVNQIEILYPVAMGQEYKNMNTP